MNKSNKKVKMNKLKKKLEIVSVVVISVIVIITTIFVSIENKKQSTFVEECPFCHSKNISHEKPKYKFIENYVVTSYASGSSSNPSGISNPIAHFDVKYHCNDCNKTFNNDLELDLLLEKNQKHFTIEYKE